MLPASCRSHPGSRTFHVNAQTRRLVKAFEWGVTEELVPPAVFEVARSRIRENSGCFAGANDHRSLRILTNSATPSKCATSKPAVWQSLEAIRPLKVGRTEAPELPPVGPVSWETVVLTAFMLL
jgi:hypothetical protein